MHLSALRAKKSEILAIAEKYGVRNIRVFGSTIRGDATETSDVDFLIDIDEEKTFFDVLDCALELEQLLDTHVDLVEPEAIRHPLLKERIFSEATQL